MRVRWRRQLREGLVVGAVAVGAAVVFTWPLVLSPGQVAHDPYDPLAQAWVLDWVQHALGTPARVWDTNAFLPNDRTLAYSDSLLGAAVLLLPLRWLGATPLGVLNAGTLLGYVVSAAAGYAFGRVVTGRTLVGAATGAAFAFGTYGAFLGQHMNILLHPGPALAGVAVWLLAEQGPAARERRWLLVAVTAAVALQATVSWYTAAITIVAAAAVAAARWGDLGRTGRLGLAGALAGAVVLVLPLAWPYLENVRTLEGDFTRDLDDFGASGADFSAVDPELTLWGGPLGSSQGLLGQPTFPGATLLVLAGVGLLGWRRTAAPVRRTALALVAAGAVLGIGTGDDGWRRFTPYRLVYEYVPGATALRATGRFWLVGLLGLGLLAGLGAAALAGWLEHRTRLGRTGAGILAGTLALGGVLIEGHGSWTDPPQVRAGRVNAELARLPGDEGVLYLPLPPRSAEEGLAILNQSRVVFGTTRHHRPTPNGTGSFFPDSFFELGERMEDLPGEDALARLRALDIGYVVVAPDPGRWGALRDRRRAEPLELVADLDGSLLYRVPEAWSGTG